MHYFQSDEVIRCICGPDRALLSFEETDNFFAKESKTSKSYDQATSPTCFQYVVYFIPFFCFKRPCSFMFIYKARLLINNSNPVQSLFCFYMVFND